MKKFKILTWVAVLSVAIYFITSAMLLLADDHIEAIIVNKQAYATASKLINTDQFASAYNSAAAESYSLLNNAYTIDDQSIKGYVKDAKLAENGVVYTANTTAIINRLRDAYKLQSTVAIILLLLFWSAYLYIMITIVYNLARVAKRQQHRAHSMKNSI